VAVVGGRTTYSRLLYRNVNYIFSTFKREFDGN
jgi:hypothetical protein